MGLYIPATSPVAQMFRAYLKDWQDALEAWTKWCKAGEQERQTLQATGGLVAQASGRPQYRSNPTLSDAPKPTGPSGLSPQAADRLGVLKERAAKCEQQIKRIQHGISMLRKASTTGMWAGDRLEFVVFKEKKYISRAVARVSRGEEVEVLEKAGDWWRVRTWNGLEGWVNQAVIAPLLPVRLWDLAKPGANSPSRDEVEVGGGGGGRG